MSNKLKLLNAQQCMHSFYRYTPTLPVLVTHIPGMYAEIVEEQTYRYEREASKKHLSVQHGSIQKACFSTHRMKQPDTQKQPQAQPKLPRKEERTLASTPLAVLGQLDVEK